MKRILITGLIFLSIFTVHAQKVELVVQTGHPYGIRSMALSPDGNLLGSSGNDGSIILWDAKSGMQIKTFKINKKDDVPSVAFSPDGKWFAAALEDQVVVIDVQRTEIAKVLNVPSSNMSVVFTADGKYLLSAGYEGKVSVWHNGEFDLVKQFNPYEGVYKYHPIIYNLQVSPDGSQFALVAGEAGMLLFDLPKNDQDWENILTKRKVVDINANKVTYVAKGKYIIIFTDAQSLATYDVAANKIIAKTDQQPYELLSRGVEATADDGFFYEYYAPDRKVRKRSIPDLKDLGAPVSIVTKYERVRYLPEQNLSFGRYENGELVQLDQASLLPKGPRFSAKTLISQNIAVSPDGRLLAINTGNIFIWDMQQNRIVKQFRYPAKFLRDADPLKFDGTGKNLYVTEGADLVQWDVATWKIKKVYKHESIIIDFAISKDGKYVATVGNATVGRLNLWNTTTGLLQASQKRTQGFDGVDFSNDGKSLAVTGGLTPSVNYTIPALSVIYDGDSFSTGDRVQFSPDDRAIYTLRRNSIQMSRPTTKFSSVIYEVPDSLKQTFPLKALLLSADGKAIGDYPPEFGDRLAAIRKSDRKLLNDPDDYVNTVAYSANGKFYATATISGQIMIRNAKDEVICLLYLFNNGLDWAVLTPDGRFDATIKAQNQLYYHRGTEILPLAALFEQYYTPRLLPRLLGGEVFPSVNINILDIKARPIVKIDYLEGTRNLSVVKDIPFYRNTSGFAEITVTAAAPADAIDEIRMFHNGKIVTLTTRNLIVADDQQPTVTRKYRLALLPGTNYIRALALNRQRTESLPAEIAVSYELGSAKPVTPINPTEIGVLTRIEKTAKLHLLVVGINKYQNPAMALNYAIADATSFKNEVEKGMQTMIKGIQTYFVSDAQADQAGILKAFEEVKKNAKAEDVFVFYYAGHGKINSTNKQFYLVPNDVTDLKNIDAALVAKGIPSERLQQYAIDIAAQKQLFILDACQSAGAFSQLMKNDGEQQKSLAVLARSTGTHWLAASGSQQLANEFVQLGHGAFTYALLKGLDGGAATNNMITVNGLKNFLVNLVPDLTKKYNGAPQYPASFGYGSDFPMELLPKK